MAGIIQLAALAGEVKALEEELERRKWQKVAPWFAVLSDEDLALFAALREVPEAAREQHAGFARVQHISDLQADIVSEGGTPSDFEATLYPDRIAQREAARLEQLASDHQKYLEQYQANPKNKHSYAAWWLRQNGFEADLKTDAPQPVVRELKTAPIAQTDDTLPDASQPAPAVKAIEAPPPKCKNCGTKLKPNQNEAFPWSCGYCGAAYNESQLSYNFAI